MADIKHINLEDPIITIERVHWMGDVPCANLTINGVTIYGVTVRTTRTGEDFLAWPSRQGSDGKWYCHARANLSDADTMLAIRKIRRMLKEAD